MSAYLIFGTGVLLGAALATLVLLLIGARRQRGRREAEPERKQVETMKKIVWACVLNGFAWIWCSYILAAMDKMQIAETLSTAAVTQIIGVVLAYAIKAVVENLSKHNHWPDKGTEDAAAEPEAEPGPEPGPNSEAKG